MIPVLPISKCITLMLYHPDYKIKRVRGWGRGLPENSGRSERTWGRAGFSAKSGRHPRSRKRSSIFGQDPGWPSTSGKPHQYDRLLAPQVDFWRVRTCTTINITPYHDLHRDICALAFFRWHRTSCERRRNDELRRPPQNPIKSRDCDALLRTDRNDLLARTQRGLRPPQPA